MNMPRKNHIHRSKLKFTCTSSLMPFTRLQFAPPRDKTNQVVCVPSEDSDQPGHPPSLIRVFAVRMKKAWVLSYPLTALRRLWSDWADAQADLSLSWAQSFCWFCHLFSTDDKICYPMLSFMVFNCQHHYDSVVVNHRICQTNQAKLWQVRQLFCLCQTICLTKLPVKHTSLYNVCQKFC